MKYAWIKKQREPYPLEILCAALAVSPSGYSAWRGSDGPRKRLSETALLALFVEAFITEAAVK